MALSPWLWLIFGLSFGSSFVVCGWWLWMLWNKHKTQKDQERTDDILTPGHHETPPEPALPQRDYPRYLDVDFETTV